MRIFYLCFALCSGPVLAGGFLPEPSIDLDFSSGAKLAPDQWARKIGIYPDNRAFYTSEDQNISYDGEALVIEARKQNYKGPIKGQAKSPSPPIESREISSASIISRAQFRFGRFEIVAKTPEVAGVQPAIWLQGHTSGLYGEIDIMEAVGLRRPNVKFATIYSGTNPSSATKNTANRNLPSGFHKYTLDWTPEEIIISYDDQLVIKKTDVNKIDNLAPLGQPMKLRINLAIGTNWSGPIADESLPVQMKIRSIKYWQYQP